jgi:hypothetical protein
MYGNPAFTQQVGLGCRGWVAAHVDRGQPLCFQGLSQIQSGWFCWVIAAVSAGSKKNQPKVRSWIWPDKVRIGWLDNQSWFSLWVDGGKRSVSLQRLVCPGKTEGMSVPPHLCGHTKHYDRKCLKRKWDFTALGLKRTVAIFANLLGIPVQNDNPSKCLFKSYVFGNAYRSTALDVSFWSRICPVWPTTCWWFPCPFWLEISPFNYMKPLPELIPFIPFIPLTFKNHQLPPCRAWGPGT